MGLAVGCVFALVAASAQAADYYVAPMGDDNGPGTQSAPWETIQKAADNLQPGDTVFVAAGTYAEHVRPQTSGTASAPITYTVVPGAEVIVDGSSFDLPEWTGLFGLFEVDYIVISGFRVQHAGPHDGDAGIHVSRCDNVVIENNRTYDTTSSGIGIWQSTNVIVRNNEVELACNDGSQECLTIAQTDGFEVVGNHIHHGGPGSNGGEGIDVKDGSANGSVHGNLVNDITRLGIYVDAWDKSTHDIDVFGNVVRDCKSNGFAVATESGGFLERVRIFNNVAYANANVGLSIADWGPDGKSHGMDDILIINNTFFDNGRDGWGGGILVENVEATNVVIRNNILSDNLSFQVGKAVDPAGLVVDHNLIHGFRGAEEEIRGDDYVEGDPLFEDAAAASFRLTSESPAIDTATSDRAPDTDFDGNARPVGAGYDIGAFEFGAGPADAGSGGASGGSGSGGSSGAGGSAGGAGSAGSGGSGGAGGASVPSDGGQTAPGSSDDDGGCGCRTAQPRPGQGALLLLCLALVVVNRRRR
jgi:parallel beta-helix repeat protein